ncbi:MAG: rhomboid family intramembrane serine protease [Candidatus Nanohaloarchaea archaeon]
MSRFRFVALQFCLLLSIIFSIQLFTGFDPSFAPGDPWWKYFTSILGHGGPEHLLNNLFFIGLFGSIYERLTSGRTFLLTFFSTALFANLSAFLFYPAGIIGASGGGTGVLAAFAAYRPNHTGLALGVPMPMWAVLGIYVLINSAGMTAVTGTAYAAHMMGMAAGFVIGYRLRDRPYLEFEDREEDSWEQKIRQWEEKYMMD